MAAKCCARTYGKHLLHAYNDIASLAKETNVDLRTAAYQISVSRVLRAIELGGS
jgi:glutamate dehydrogenase/leucine dehydrogenase